MIDRTELMRDIERIIQSKGVRSADRAYMETMLRQMRAGNALNYQERVNLWAYLNRYRSDLA
jgi:hypothetical protein